MGTMSHISKTASDTLVAPVQFALMTEFMDSSNGLVAWSRFTQDLAGLVAIQASNPPPADGAGGNCATM